MTAGWVAGSVRARAMARRRLGAARARSLALSPSLDTALQALGSTSYAHDLPPQPTLGAAQHAVAETVLWDLRVLAGWLPRGAADVVRLLAGWFELANVEEHLSALAGHETHPQHDVGALGSVSRRLADTTSPQQVRTVLATSPWGDPGGAEAHAIMLGLRLVWAERVCAQVPAAQARAWARGAAALVVARERFVVRRPLPAAAAASARRLLGSTVDDAGSLSLLRASVAPEARWALDVASEQSLWLAEARWWRRVDSDAQHLLREARPGPAPVIGAAAALAADAVRVCAALECADRGAGVAALEAFDAVA